MKILYVGDIMGAAGRKVVAVVLPDLKKELGVDFVIAQGENMDDWGKGPRPSDIAEMRAAGVDFFTGGNHSFSNSATDEMYMDPSAPIVRPANVEGALGEGFKVVDHDGRKILIVSILGQTVGSQKVSTTNPLTKIDEILNTLSIDKIDVSVVNFHGDFSSEKIVFGYYLDGRVSAVIGDHWHVPTADAKVLPGGTAHITDVGMCGALHSSLGVKTTVIVDRWKTGKSSRNEMEETGPLQFNAVLVETNADTHLAKSITHIQRTVE